MHMFQFQIGAIKSSLTKTETNWTTTFQFQIGAIKSRCVAVSFLLHLLTFQFQIGAIKRMLEIIADRLEDIVSIPNWCD